MHKTTSHASAAIADVEHDAITPRNNKESMTFFISVTSMINEKLRI
ncbi:hypothetical protein AB07_1678 [Citrobacter freundii]|nr:hypothetical protein AB07_1678 [Citrobacter freundii]